MTARRARAWPAFVVVTAMFVASCGSGEVIPVGAAVTEESVRLRVPQQVVGLTFSPEELPDRGIEAVQQPYVDGVALFSIRDGDVLRGTLQVTRLNRRARPDDDAFRDQIVGQISAVEPTKLRVSERVVHAAGGSEQDVYIWFEGRGLFVLAVHEAFPFPRTLLRRLLETDMGL